MLSPKKHMSSDLRVNPPGVHQTVLGANNLLQAGFHSNALIQKPSTLGTDRCMVLDRPPQGMPLMMFCTSALSVQYICLTFTSSPRYLCLHAPNITAQSIQKHMHCHMLCSCFGNTIYGVPLSVVSDVVVPSPLVCAACLKQVQEYTGNH